MLPPTPQELEEAGMRAIAAVREALRTGKAANTVHTLHRNAVRYLGRPTCRRLLADDPPLPPLPMRDGGLRKRKERRRASPRDKRGKRLQRKRRQALNNAASAKKRAASRQAAYDWRVAQIKVLQRAVRSGAIHTIIQPFEGDNPPTADDISSTQSSRVTRYAEALRYYYCLLNKQFMALPPAERGLPGHAFHERECARVAAEPYELTASTLVKVLHVQWAQSIGPDATRLPDGSERGAAFRRDGRGSHARSYILSEEDLLDKFKAYMIAQRYLTVDKAVNYVNCQSTAKLKHRQAVTAHVEADLVATKQQIARDGRTEELVQRLHVIQHALGVAKKVQKQHADIVKQMTKNRCGIGGDFLGSKEEIEALGRYNVSFPVKRSVVYNWMTHPKCGAVCTKAGAHRLAL